MNTKEQKDKQFEVIRFEQLTWQSQNTTPQQRLEFAEEMLELMWAAGYNYNDQKALMYPDYWQRRGRA